MKSSISTVSSLAFSMLALEFSQLCLHWCWTSFNRLYWFTVFLNIYFNLIFFIFGWIWPLLWHMGLCHTKIFHCSICTSLYLWCVDSIVCGLRSCSMWKLNSLTRDQTCVLCIRRQILHQWTTREVSWFTVFIYSIFIIIFMLQWITCKPWKILMN